MVRFNELRITPDKKLIIDASIEDSSYYDNIVISGVAIDNLDSFIIGGPSDSPLYFYKPEEVTENNIYSLEDNNCNPILEDLDYSECYCLSNDEKKHIRLILDSKDLGLDLSNNMLFVYILTEGDFSEGTPKDLLTNTAMNTVIDLYNIFSDNMKYIKELNKECKIPKNLIDSIIRFKALLISIITGNYPLAIKYWNKFYKK